MLEEGKRIHGLDALRAVAMLLGVFLHAAIAYKVTPHRNWLHDEQFNSWVFDYMYYMLHSFRMPLFFLIAGFFARLLYYKIGEKAFIIHRWKRVVLPFVLAMIFILPITVAPLHFYTFYYKEGLSFALALKKSVLKIFGYNGLAHFWFLYDLIIFYIGLILCMKIKKSAIVNKYYSQGSNWLNNLNFKKWYWVLIFALPIWLCLIPEHRLLVITDISIIPKHINNVFLYGYVFGIGWLFNKRTDVFLCLRDHYRLFLVIGFLLGSFLFYFEWKFMDRSNELIKAVAHFGASLQIVLLMLGLIGLFLVVFKFENRTWKYISDASYWVYLIHLSIVITLQICFLQSSVPGVLRFPLVLSISLIVSFLSYYLFVRYTFIGNILHGPRKRNK